ncbi:MAG: C45 family peptidase, partial [Verrucomicrobiota bacterium]
LAILLAVSSSVWLFILTTPDSRGVASALYSIHALAQPGGPRVDTTLRIVEVRGLPEELKGQTAELSFRAPDKLLAKATVDGHEYRIARDGDAIWLHAPHKNLAIRGSNAIPRFAADKSSLETIELPPLVLNFESWKLAILPALIDARSDADGRVHAQLKTWAAQKLDLPADAALSFLKDDRGLPTEISFTQGGTHIDLALEDLQIDSTAAADADFALDLDAPVDEVALSHLSRFVETALGNLDAKIPTLPPTTGARRVLGEHGKGRLESHDDVKVLFLRGSPEEMGEQHGTLMRDEVRNLIDRIVYGVGVGSSLDKGRWFFGEIEEAQSRFEPFTDPRYLREMDALAAAVGVHRQEARIANFFPELFHCSGFALHGSATVDGRMYHGRVLDYLRGLGLEQNAVVMIVEPDEGNAWVNVGYAGFVGSVTAMNEKQVAIGEMGGRGEGDWDGKPMAQLMREVMERADTIEEAVEIFRRGPRTCEYYYVISDAKSKRAVGIKATPDIFETVWSGESHPQLPHPVEDTVLLSAGDRYEELVRRVRDAHGRFDADSARALMDPPVCMNSNIQSVLFAPDTLDFWVANADSENVASLTRYTKFNLRQLLGRSAEDDSLTKR